MVSTKCSITKTVLCSIIFSISFASVSNAGRVNISNWRYCDKTVDLKTHHNNFNNHYLSATSNLGKLSVRSGKNSSTQFTIKCYKSDNKIALKTSQNRYVVAIEEAIKADRTRVGNWEKFEVHTGKKNDSFAFKSHKGKYIVAESNKTVRANRTKIGNYESFIIDGGINSGGNPSNGADYLIFNKVTGLNTGDLGVEVRYANSNNNNPLNLYIKKASESDNSYEFVRREGGAPYEWGTLNPNKTDSKIQNLSKGTYTLKAVSDLKVNGINAAKSISYDVTASSSSGGGNSGGGSNSGNGKSNFQVKIDGQWKSVCCEGSTLKVSNRSCTWKESGRVLTDLTANKQLDCPENGGREAKCTCSSSGERMHGAPGGQVKESLKLSNGAPIFPNIGRETCVKIVSGDKLEAKYSSVKGDKWSNSSGWPDKSCPHFRLINFY